MTEYEKLSAILKSAMMALGVPTALLDSTEPEHFCGGGTGITNFDPHEEPIYLEAIKRAQHPDGLYVVRAPYRLNQVGSDMYSLHRKRRTADLGSFWDIVREIEQHPPHQP